MLKKILFTSGVVVSLALGLVLFLSAGANTTTAWTPGDTDTEIICSVHAQATETND